MNTQLLSMLICPTCSSELHYAKKANELVCYSEQIAFSIENGIPIMLIEKARNIINKKEEVIFSE